MTTRITGGTLVSPRGLRPADLVVEDGRIAAVMAPGTAPPAGETIDATGLFVIPGALDVHVHFRQPGFDHKETWASATRAAAVGGVTMVVEMPNTDPATRDPEQVRRKLGIAGAQACVDFGIYGLIGADNLHLLRDMAAAGAFSFKVYMASDAARTRCPPDGGLLEALRITRELGRRITVHAENLAILQANEERLRAAGRTDVAAHLEMHEDLAVVEAVSRMCLFAEWTSAPIHLAHLCTRHALPVLAAAKARGVDVTAETCPHYLLLSTEDGARLGPNYLRVKPPVREPGHAEPLFEALRSGLIDILSTDHAPHLPEEKRRDSIWDCACGFPGVETSMPLMLAQVSAGRMTLPDYVRMACEAPARAFGLAGRKGCLEVGADADIVLLDMDRRGTVTAAGLHSIGNATPFEGFALHGLPVRALVRGRTVALEGRPVPAEGWGRNLAG